MTLLQTQTQIAQCWIRRGHGIRNPTQEAAGSVTAVHEDGEDTGGSSVVASGNDEAATSAAGET